jgi:hypothetical protein
LKRLVASCPIKLESFMCIEIISIQGEGGGKINLIQLISGKIREEKPTSFNISSCPPT